jgi:hypothetical protein
MTIRRTVLLSATGTCAALAVLGVAWLVISALMARAQLEQVRTELPRLRAALSAGDVDRARTLSAELATHARHAHELSTGPAWWVAANVPMIGAPAHTVRTIAAQTDSVSRSVLPGVVELAGDLTGTSLRDGDSVNLAPLAKAEPVLQSSAHAADAASRAVGEAPGHTWLMPVNSARTTVAADLAKLSGQLSGANRAVKVLLPMLGQYRPQRYFVGFENEAEARGLGGLPGAFVIVTADHGTIRFTHFGSDTELAKVSTNLNLGTDYANRYGADDPTGTYVNSDVSPNFPDAARIWAAMWQRVSGQRVDGAIAIDPTALSYLLRVTGPAALPGGGVVSASNVVALTEKNQYALFSDTAARKAYLVQVSKAIARRLVHGGDSVGLVRAAARAAGERRLVFWTADQPTETMLTTSGWGGVLSAGDGPFSGFVVVNAAGSKLDYYLDRSMSYVRRGCGAGGTSVATLRLTNNAPSSGLPPYVTTRADVAPRGAKPGDNRLLVTYYASAGARIPSVTVDGQPVAVATATEQGLVTVTVDVELPVGSSRTITVRVTEPPADGPVQVLDQPLVRPMTVHVSGSDCGVSAVNSRGKSGR